MVIGAIAFYLYQPPLAAATGGQADPQDLKTMSIEQLMEIDVTLATREPEPVGRTAAAITVVTNDDIRRSGVTTIADAVALAEGVHVARFNNGTWAVSARGFNSTSANKLLVMVDGRIEYSPLFSGVFWNTLDYTLEDIDRIEVIRGPGATLWGTNAVNGVINIVTRHSRDTQVRCCRSALATRILRSRISATAAPPRGRRIACTASSRGGVRRPSTTACPRTTAGGAARSAFASTGRVAEVNG